ncbi:hypothetical protein [Streptomyces iconiensis]|uniref:Chitin-binding type-2 domain-containing protein n=1 Tax=Streptomyces iconiensis TaxID=1384038 RepID=A0ABT6ZQJ2_9ACTN|nr:hypothetical protein [Streptomyces iconiensis]MDJ1131318.1 hypothetical protein [Streptomyces iconiensis]
MTRETTERTTECLNRNRFARGALAVALATGMLALAVPAVAAPCEPARPCPTGRYWEPNNKACVPMSPPVHRY